jgi:hypothetical protein
MFPILATVKMHRIIVAAMQNAPEQRTRAMKSFLRSGIWAAMRSVMGIITMPKSVLGGGWGK